VKDTEQSASMLPGTFGPMAVLVILAGVISALILQLVANDRMSAMAGTMSVAVVLACVLAALFVLAKRMTDRVQGFAQHLDQAAEETLARKESGLVERQEELGELVASMNKMAASMEQIIMEVKGATVSLREVSDDFTQSFRDMSTAMTQVDKEVKTISENTVYQSERTSEIGSKMEDINHAADGIAEHAGALTACAGKMKESGQEAGKLMTVLARAHEAGSEAITEMQAHTGAASQSAAQIRILAELMTGISGQANLLALNASIEATRAGEKGKGFAQQAEDSQALADRLREALERTNGIANELTSHSDASAKAAQKVASSLTGQTDKFAKARELMETLNCKIAEADESIHEITEQAAGLKSSKEAAASGIEALTQATQENAERARETLNAMDAFGQIVEECEESTEQVKNVSNELIDHLGKFKITDFRNEAGGGV